MPCPFLGGSAVFDIEGVGEDGLSVAFGKVFFVQGFHILEHLFEFGDDAFGEDGEAVVVAFSAADDDLAVVEVEVFDAQAHTFHDAEPGAVHDLCHQAGRSPHPADDLHGFGVGQNCRKPLRAGCLGEVGRQLDIHLQDGTIEEEDGAESLVGSRDGDLALSGKMGNEGADLGFSHVFGMALAVEEDVALDPVLVGLFGAVGVMFGAQGVADLIHELFPVGGRFGLERGYRTDRFYL